LLDKIGRRRVEVISLARRLLFTPYIWGGNSPFIGFDCSGYIVYLYQAIGILPLNGDWTAAALGETFGNMETLAPQAGGIVTYKNDRGHVSHIMLILNPELCIGAAGGGRWATTPDISKSRHAYVKILPIDYRPPYKFLDPLYS